MEIHCNFLKSKKLGKLLPSGEFIKGKKNKTKKKQTLWPLFMDGVQLPQG